MFAMEGARGVTITYLPEERPDAEDAAKAIEAAGSKAVIVECNLEHEEGCRKVVEEHIKAFGTINVLVNNASKQMYVVRAFLSHVTQLIMLLDRIEKDFIKIDLENVKSTFQTNILQMFAITKFALPHMKRGASIVNSTSVTAYRGSAQLGTFLNYTVNSITVLLWRS